MRNYIILNGQNSNSISGLLIQSLAPISKPLMRTEIEEIDGRDGDIVTKLGYSAYDKEITIGLYGDFDINEVIAYFNSEGTVTFSNEPDKYYNYQIAAQIDFERLVRYKTATVTMHCQPFKYSATEGTEIFGASSNLVTIPNFSRTTNGITVSVANNIMTVSGKGSAATEFYVPIDTLSLAAGSYTMTAIGSGTAPEACSLRVIYDSPSSANSFGGSYVTLKNNTDVSLSATLTATKTYNYVYLYIAAGKNMNFTLNLQIVDQAQVVISGEGSNIVLENSAEAPFSQFDLKGNTEQDGTPTPDAPVAVQTVTGENVVKICGKNLFDASQDMADYFINSSGAEVANTAWDISDYIPVVAGQTYSYQGLTQVGNAPYSAFYDASKTFVSSFKQARGNNTITIPSGVAYVRFTIYHNELYGDDDNQTFQFEKGSTATDYEPYQGQSYPISLGSIELCKIDTYQDYIYKSGGKWYVHKEVGKENWTSELNYSIYTSGGVERFFRQMSPLAVNNSGRSANFKTQYFHFLASGDAVGGALLYNRQLQVMFTTDTSTTVEQFKTWLDSHPMSVYYPLATPTDTEITNQALVEQLDDIYYHAHAYKERTHVNSTYATGNVPHIIAAAVTANMGDITVTNSGNFISKPTMTIFGSGNIGVYLNGIQLFQIALGDTEYITIDCAAMEAYKDTLETLQNRLVTGDYSNFVLNPGDNTISFSGSVTKFEISNYSRWL